MKKALIVFLCLTLLETFFALAEDNPFDFPPTDGSFDRLNAVRESIEIEINGSSTSLAFDESAEYSSITNGTVQASFYAYSDNSDYLYELYMIFPDTVQSGSTITPEYAIQNDPDCSVVLIVSTKDLEQYYFAGTIDGAIYPSDASYTMRFDSVSTSDGARVYSGTLSASLMEMDMDSGAPLVSFRIENAPFSFTMPSDGSGSDAIPDFPDDDPNPFDEAPAATPKATPDAWRV